MGNEMSKCVKKWQKKTDKRKERQNKDAKDSDAKIAGNGKRKDTNADVNDKVKNGKFHKIKRTVLSKKEEKEIQDIIRDKQSHQKKSDTMVMKIDTNNEGSNHCEENKRIETTKSQSKGLNNSKGKTKSNINDHPIQSATVKVKEHALNPISQSKPQLTDRFECNSIVERKSESCYICTDIVKDNIAITNCSHVFCDSCILKWINFSNHCPNCKKQFTRIGHKFRSVYDYRVTDVQLDESKIVDSFGAAYLFDAFRQNFQCIESLEHRAKELNKMINTTNATIKTKNILKERALKTQVNCLMEELESVNDKKKQSDEGRDDISELINNEFMAFWNEIIRK